MSEQITPNPSVPSQVVAKLTFPKMINNLGIIPTSYKDSMSYYECLAWLCKFLEETVIPTVNENGEAVEELQTLYVELNNYVSNYLDNYNFQQEVNNKLDELTESGYFENLITDYLKLTRIYNTTSEMILDSENIINGMKIQTLGFYEINDGGNGNFLISNNTSSNYAFEVGNLYAIPIIKNDTLNVKSIGAKGDKIQNDTAYFEKAISILVNRNGGKLYIPIGDYLINKLPLKNKISIYGDSEYTSRLFSTNSTLDGKFIYIDDAPVQLVEYKDFSIYNETTSNIETGFHLEAIEQQVSPYTGGLWYATFENITIVGFKRGMLTKAIDNRGDLANQFLRFIRVKILRNGLSSDELCAEFLGQLGQTYFEQCEFDSRDLGDAQYNLAPGINVKIGGDSLPTLMSFETCTFQNSEIGIETQATISNFNSCWFENLGISVHAMATSKVFIKNSNFANAGSNVDTTGCILKGEPSTYISLTNNRIAGRVDKLIIAPNSRYVENFGNGVDLPTQGCTKQLAISNNALSITSNKMAIVNIGDNSTLSNINSSKSSLEEFVLIAFGELTTGKSILINATGNITTPKGQNITLHSGDVVKFIKSDLPDKWVVESIAKIPMKANGSPEVAYPNGRFETGEIIYNSNPNSNSRVGWICTAGGTPGTWKSFGQIDS